MDSLESWEFCHALRWVLGGRWSLFLLLIVIILIVRFGLWPFLCFPEEEIETKKVSNKKGGLGAPKQAAGGVSTGIGPRRRDERSGPHRPDQDASRPTGEAREGDQGVRAAGGVCAGGGETQEEGRGAGGELALDSWREETEGPTPEL